MKQRTGFRTMSLLLSLMFIISVILAGCGGNNKGASEEISVGDKTPEQTNEVVPKPATITMMSPYASNTEPKDNGPVISAIEEFNHVDLNVTWVPTNVYAEKLSVTLSSGEMPQVIRVTDPFAPNILNGINVGMFWELGQYLDDYENLTTYDPIVLNNMKIKGEIYGIPLLRPIVRDGLIIRGSWLEKLKMEPPTTLDEFYNLLVAFKNQDPDDNGQSDTYGMMVYEGLRQPFESVQAWSGAPNKWKVQDGKFIKDAETTEYMDGLKFFKKLYDEKLINQDFPIIVRNEARKDLYNNKVGVTIEGLADLFPFYSLKMAELGMDFDLTTSPPVEGRSFAGLGYSGMFMIPKSSVKTEAELRTILQYFDKQRSPETVKQFSDLVVENAKKPAGEQFNVDDLNNLLVNDVPVYPPAISDRNEMVKDRLEELSKTAIPDPSVGLISETYLEKGAELDMILKDAATQFIVGDIDEAGFKAAVEKWKNTGGSNVANELEKLYNQ